MSAICQTYPGTVAGQQTLTNHISGAKSQPNPPCGETKRFIKTKLMSVFLFLFHTGILKKSQDYEKTGTP